MAEIIFDQLAHDFPNNIDYADVYANTLFVLDKKEKLSYLAHRAIEIDKYRWETCIVIGRSFSF